MKTSKRLRPQERIDQLIALAADEIDRQRYLPVHYSRLAKVAGVTPQLIYNYFPQEAMLYDAIVEYQLNALEQGLQSSVDIETATDNYCQYVMESGASLAIVLSDRQISRQLRSKSIRRLIRLFLTYARMLKRETGAQSRLCLLFLLSAASVPEEFARLYRSGKLKKPLAIQYAVEMISTGVATLKTD